MLFPFLPFMVKFLVPEVSETALGELVVDFVSGVKGAET